MTSYERVTYKPEGAKRARTVILQSPQEITLAGSPTLVGIEVDKDGYALLGADPQAPIERRHVISLALVAKRERVVMDRTYGEFVPDGTATQQQEA